VGGCPVERELSDTIRVENAAGAEEIKDGGKLMESGRKAQSVAADDV